MRRGENALLNLEHARLVAVPYTANFFPSAKHVRCSVQHAHRASINALASNGAWKWVSPATKTHFILQPLRTVFLAAPQTEDAAGHQITSHVLGKKTARGYFNRKSN